jgi:hypothetical protein
MEKSLIDLSPGRMFYMKFQRRLIPNKAGLLGFVLLVICLFLQIALPKTLTLEFVTGFLGALSIVLIGCAIYGRIVHSIEQKTIKNNSSRRSRTWW